MVNRALGWRLASEAGGMRPRAAPGAMPGAKTPAAPRPPQAPPELSTYSRLVGASRHRSMAGPGSRSLSTEDGPRDVSFLIGPRDDRRPRGRRISRLLWNREWRAGALEPGTPRALSPRPGVSALDAQARPSDYPGESYTNSQDMRLRRARRHDPHRSARRQCSAV
jgi:hypothetical protein